MREEQLFLQSGCFFSAYLQYIATTVFRGYIFLPYFNSRNPLIDYARLDLIWIFFFLFSRNINRKLTILLVSINIHMRNNSNRGFQNPLQPIPEMTYSIRHQQPQPPHVGPQYTDSRSGSADMSMRERVGRKLPLPMTSRYANNQPYSRTPTEYTNRARDEIKKRLFQPDPNRSGDNLSVYDNRSLSSSNSSLFSQSTSMATEDSSSSSIGLDKSQVQLPMNIVLTVEQALPRRFDDMYTQTTFLTNKILPNGRPDFTTRELIDWQLNDIRSLLIIDQLEPEWSGKLPQIIGGHPNTAPFRFQLLPLCCSDEFIIGTLVGSDIYLEANLDYEFKWRSAKYIVKTARERHEMMNGNIKESFMKLQKFEWRNIIENYLLNLAVEAQCRFDFRNNCEEFKKWKASQNSIPSPQRISLSKSEKNLIWQQSQSVVYKRLNLDWQPDTVNNL